MGQIRNFTVTGLEFCNLEWTEIKAIENMARNGSLKIFHMNCMNIGLSRAVKITGVL